MVISKVIPAQEEFLGMSPSAKQAAAAREQEGRGRMTTNRMQRDLDEGLFAPKRAREPSMFD